MADQHHDHQDEIPDGPQPERSSDRLSDAGEVDLIVRGMLVKSRQLARVTAATAAAANQTPDPLADAKNVTELVEYLIQGQPLPTPPHRRGRLLAFRKR
jgi:hypothetical protein